MNAQTPITRDDTMERPKKIRSSPRFYTTDFDALDAIDVSLVRKEWDQLIADMKADPNKKHFKHDDILRA